MVDEEWWMRSGEIILMVESFERSTQVNQTVRIF